MHRADQHVVEPDSLEQPRHPRLPGIGLALRAQVHPRQPPQRWYFSQGGDTR